VIKTLGLRVVGSAVPGGRLSVCEFVPSALEFIGGEIWSGEGSLLFTGASEFSALHRLSMLEMWKPPPSTTRRSGYVVPQKPIRSALEEQARPGTAEVAMSRIAHDRMYALGGNRAHCSGRGQPQ